MKLIKRYKKPLTTRFNRNYLPEINKDIEDMTYGYVINKCEDFIEDDHVYIVYTETNSLNNGKYIIEKRLGKGSEGIVYLVKDTKENNKL